MNSLDNSKAAETKPKEKTKEKKKGKENVTPKNEKRAGRGKVEPVEEDNENDIEVMNSGLPVNTKKVQDADEMLIQTKFGLGRNEM